MRSLIYICKKSREQKPVTQSPLKYILCEIVRAVITDAAAIDKLQATENGIFTVTVQ
jgi:hypothetical protein